jgi:hypothetical protein
MFHISIEPAHFGFAITSSPLWMAGEARAGGDPSQKSRHTDRYRHLDRTVGSD